jgi:hypothetical protein
MYPDWWKTTGVPVWKGEYQFVQTLGKEKARELLEKHWDTWVTEDDFRTLSQWGIKHLRIPIGYWILGAPYLRDDEWYVEGGWKYLLRALTWAKKYNMQTIIDLHGAPGVQNGRWVGLQVGRAQGRRRTDSMLMCVPAMRSLLPAVLQRTTTAGLQVSRGSSVCV